MTLDREKDFCAGVTFGLMFAVHMARGLAKGTDDRTGERPWLLVFADVLESERNPELYARAVSEWTERAE